MPSETKSCLRCKHPSGCGDRFCSRCGERLAAEGLTFSWPPTRRERKLVSVLFADVKGSTEVISHEDPERASERLERAIDLMRDAVHRFGGTVNWVQGDGIMALFGAPVEYEDHCVRACGAALAMLDSTNREPTGSGPLLKIRVGISSGHVVTLPVASDAAIHYDAMGAVVHLAARLEQTAEPGSALVSLETLKGTHDAFETRRRELTGLRGLPAIVPAFELISWNAKRGARPPVRASGARSIFGGREAAIATLYSALGGLGPRRGHVVAVSGEAGVGKSRLLAEFFARVGNDVRVCSSHSSPYKSFGYGPLADLVAELAGVNADAAPQDRRERLAALTQGRFLGSQHDTIALDALLDLATSHSDLLSLAPFDRRQRIENAAIALFAAISQEKPLILLVEDIHWLDMDARSQVTRLCNGVRNARCLVMLSFRDTWEGAPELLEQSSHKCELAPLEEADAVEMLGALLRPGRGAASLSRKILERAQGNPLFIEETLLSLHQIGTLLREGGTYSLQGSVEGIPLSPTVRGLLAGRIDRLENEQKDVLQAAAVVGQNVTLELLRSVLNVDVSIVARAVERLIALDLLAVDGAAQPSDCMNLMFRHPLIRELTYEQTLLRDRVRIHQLMLDRLEEERRRDLRGRADILAEHALRAEAWEKAAQYMLQAGNEAFWRDAKVEAARLLLKGLEAVERCGADKLDPNIVLQLRLALRNPLFQLARMDELGVQLKSARPAALKLSHPIDSGRYHIFQSHYYWFTGDVEGALKEAEAAEALAASSGLYALSVRARFQKGLVHLSRGKHREAIATMDEVSAAIESQEPQDAFGMNRSLLVTTLGYSARARAELGQIVEGRRDAARSLATARELDNQFAWVFAYIAEGWVNFRADDCERALPFLERAYKICADEEVPLMAPVAGAFLALALLGVANDRTTNPADSNRVLALSERAVNEGREFRFGAFQPMRLAILSRALVLSGRSEEALERALTARETARMQSEPVSEIEALIALSEARCSLGMDWRDVLQAASSICEELQMTPAINHCRRLEVRCKERTLASNIS